MFEKPEKPLTKIEGKMTSTELEKHRAAQEAARKASEARERNLRDERGAYIVNEEEGNPEKLKKLVQEIKKKFGDEQKAA